METLTAIVSVWVLNGAGEEGMSEPPGGRGGSPNGGMGNADENDGVIEVHNSNSAGSGGSRDGNGQEETNDVGRRLEIFWEAEQRWFKAR